jgi:hypothetical protein
MLPLVPSQRPGAKHPVCLQRSQKSIERIGKITNLKLMVKTRDFFWNLKVELYHLPYTLFIIFVLRGKIYWLGKESLFRPPFKGFFKWLGGIPIDRSRSKNIVAQSIQQFHQNEKLILTIAPAGTRKRVTKWKTGFYHIAHGANVPIALGFLDYRRKAGGIGPVIYPTGNIDADMKTIRAFYGGITGKFPEKSMTTANEKQ